jgi:hypothetical protein
VLEAFVADGRYFIRISTTIAPIEMAAMMTKKITRRMVLGQRRYLTRPATTLIDIATIMMPNTYESSE